VPQLREVPGPSALGGGWRRALDLLLLISVTEFKRTYFGTVFGYLWSVARPLMLFGVLLVVFTQVFRIGADSPNYPVLLLFNIVLFGFFQEATNTAVQSIVQQESVVRKTQFPRLVIPLAVVMTALLNLLPNLAVAALFVLAWGIDPTPTWLLLPLLLCVLVVFTTAVSMLVASLFPRFRDVAIVWTVLSTVLFYGTPVLYPLDAVPEGLQQVLLLNPLTPIFDAARAWVIDPSAGGPVQAAGGVVHLLPAAAIFIAVCLLAVWVFQREAPRIAEDL
jgi:ABC-2 type transport system permease protein